MMVFSMMPAMTFADDEAAADPAAEVAVEEASEAEAVDAVTETENAAAETVEVQTGEPQDAVEEEQLVEDEELLDDEEDAELAEDEEYGEGEFSSEGTVDPDEIGADPEKLMDEFFYDGTRSSKELMSVKGDRLGGNNLKYYNMYKSLMTSVTAGSRTSTQVNTTVPNIIGKKKITAKSLGLKKLAKVSGGKLVLTSAAQKKIKALIEPENWQLVFSSLLFDNAAAAYWVDWYSGNPLWQYNMSYKGNAKAITITSSYFIYGLSVMGPFQGSTYAVNSSRISAANTAKNTAATIVSSFNNKISSGYYSGQSDAYIDKERLHYYCERIAALAEYDYDAAAQLIAGTVSNYAPWEMIYVFDGNTSTKVVCEGYAKAFKYLCDLSTFRSNWIDCQILTGLSDITDSTSGHMWNVVRMNDGLNYLVDPTWMDGTNGLKENWFLKGAAGGNADSFKVNGDYRTRSYNAETKRVFAPAERQLAQSDYNVNAASRAISLAAPKIKKPKKGKKSFTAKWYPVTAPVGALYVDGYQIQYSLKKNMKKAKTVTVMGYAQSSRVIKKLKKKKTYYVHVRSFARVGKAYYYSPWSAKKKVKTK